VASSEKWVRSTLISVLCFSFTGLVLRNVLSDNEAVAELARKTGCEGVVLDACRVNSVHRGPFAQQFSLTVGKGSKQVECMRERWLMGDYKCEVNR
jgi:hypothetical protein